MEGALLPVIVAELDAEARLRVAELSLTREIAYVPLLEAPVDASLHVLEIVSTEGGEPLLVLAEPMGVPTDAGFPLRLHPLDSPPKHRSVMPPSAAAAAMPRLRATRRRPATLSKRHTQDLAGMVGGGAVEFESDDGWIGREIANGKLVIEELVGHGGMGEVYRARHKTLGRDVAVKMLHAHFRDDLVFCARFQAEALAISALDHPNLVRIVDYGQEEDGTLYLAMDFVEGSELEDVVRAGEPMTLARIVEIGMQIAGGLGHAHARGIFHRDVKPSNVLLVRGHDDDGRPTDVVKVCDFGIATATGAAGDRVGTPAYMSPEQIRGEKTDGRSDVYALGVLLYELACGQVPFPFDDPKKVLEGHLDRTPVAPSLVRTTDARLEKLILSMLEKLPANRPKGMREVRAMLRDTLRPPSAPDLLPVGASRGERDDKATPAQRMVPEPPRSMSSQHMPAFVDPTPLAAQMVAEPVTAMRERLATLERFTLDAPNIAAAMRILLKRNEIATLAQIVGILRKLAQDPNEPRAELALRVVRSLCDPAILAPVAEQVLLEHDEIAPTLLAQLGLASAHALYAVRAKLTATSPVRGRFVATMRSIGAPALPLIVAALDKNVPEGGAPGDSKIAEDLLRALPPSNDDELGARVARCLRWGDANVRRAAISPLVGIWGDRARPYLLAVLSKDPDEGARVAAVRGLHKLHAFDEHLVRRCDALFASPSTDLRVALADAFSDVPPEARAVATEVIKNALAQKPPPAVANALEKTLRTLTS